MTKWIPADAAMSDLHRLADAALSRYENIAGAAAESVLYPHLPAAVYHADREVLSCSMLKPLLLSPAHFQASLLAPSKGSPAKDFGSLVHLVLLEPSRVREEVSVYPGIGISKDRNFKIFLEANRHRLAVDEPTFSKAYRLAEKVSSTRYRGRPLGRFIEESQCEASIYFSEPVTGLRLRVRFDALHPDVSFDLKTTRWPTPDGFARDAVDLDYDLQAAMYSLARLHFEGTPASKPFVFISAETSEPYSVCTHASGETFMQNGLAKLQECLATYKACGLVGHWPDRSCHSELEISHWQQHVRQSVGPQR